jgi:hypothetical protein
MNSTSQTRRVASISTKHAKARWRSIKHIATPHFKYFEQAVGELIEEPFEVNTLKRILYEAAAA